METRNTFESLLCKMMLLLEYGHKWGFRLESEEITLQQIKIEKYIRYESFPRKIMVLHKGFPHLPSDNQLWLNMAMENTPFAVWFDDCQIWKPIKFDDSPKKKPFIYGWFSYTLW